jgi:hypothetical protein
MRAVLQIGFLSTALAVASSSCTTGVGKPDGGVHVVVDAATDAASDGAWDGGGKCQGDGHLPQYDLQCASNVGCNGLDVAGCGCQCAKCNDMICVLEICPPCQEDGGLDAGVERDGGSNDRGYADTGCLDPLDLDGSYLDANWDSVKVYVATVSEDDINDEYFAWIVPDQRDVRYLVLGTKRVFDVRAISKDDLLNGVAVCGDWSYWANCLSCADGTGSSELFGFGLSAGDCAPTQLTGLAIVDVVFCNTAGDVLVRYLDQDYHARFNLYPLGDFSAPRSISLYNADKAGYIRLTDKAVVFVVPNPRDEILDTCMRSHDLATDKETQILCGAGTYILDSHGNRVVYQDWKNYADFGHGQSDVFVYDLDTGKEIEVTHDEFGQWCPVIHGDLVVYQDLTEFQGYEGGLGYLWVYDLSTGIRRKIPIDPMEGCPTGMNAKYVAFREGFSPIQNKMFLIDMEKAGVVKDGHVVPEAGDGGGGQ